MALLAGYKSKKTIQVDSRSESFSDVHRLFICTDTDKISTQSIHRETVPYSGLVHCVRVPSGNIVVRSNGKTLIIGNCHEVEGILRGFAEKKVTLPLHIKDEDMPDLESMKTMNDWVSWLSPFSEKFSTRARAGGEPSQQEEFLALVQDMEDLSEYFGEKFVVAVERDIIAKRSKFVFTPEYVGNLLNTYITNYGDKRIFMSGTIYSKELYCKLSGLNPAETCYIKIGSSFPKALRPIYMKPEYMVDTSHKLWDNNFAKMIANIRKVMETFHDVKGLIHAPSYHAGAVIANALRDTKRIVIHDKDNFQSTLQDFYASKGNEVFLSPVCQQGVDFKGDRARFQIILRVPYPNTSDAFMAKMVKTQFAYYNYQALIVFGQQIGRVNRSETDFGVTILMDERFEKFIGKNRNTLPRWLTEAIIIK
jgi:Rad3-related DNA helicase